MMTGDVSDIPEGELIRRVLASLAMTPRTRRARRVPLWTKVMKHFGLGSTYAWQLCQRHDFDPDQQVRP
jgi:hypothetical protein